MIVLNYLLLLQMDLPDLYEQIFNDETKVEIAAVIGGVTLIRNILERVIDIKGFFGVLLTTLASLLYGLLQYGLDVGGVTYGLLLGALAALSFFWGKNTGTVLGLFFGKKSIGIHGETLAVKVEDKNIIMAILQVLKFLVVRK